MIAPVLVKSTWRGSVKSTNPKYLRITVPCEPLADVVRCIIVGYTFSVKRTHYCRSWLLQEPLLTTCPGWLSHLVQFSELRWGVVNVTKFIRWPFCKCIVLSVMVCHLHQIANETTVYIVFQWFWYPQYYSRYSNNCHVIICLDIASIPLESDMFSLELLILSLSIN